MTTLVTGATGFVGSAVARRLVEAGYGVRVLVRSEARLTNVEDLPVEVAIGDLRDKASLAGALAGCKALFHVAADYRLWAPDPRDIYATNVTGTRNIMEAAMEAGVQRIVYTSSVATLGRQPDGSPATEDTPVSEGDMISDYKRSKFLAEQDVVALCRERGLPAVIVNPSTPIGPRDIRPTPTGRIIVEALRGRIPAYVNTGLNVVHVDDVAEGHLLAFDKGEVGERYVLGGENLSLKRVLTEIAGLAGRRPPRIHLSPNLVMPIAYLSEWLARLTGGPEPLTTVNGVRMSKKAMYFSSDKARDALDYEHRPASEAFSDAVDWFRAHGYVS
jgi:dihydroflavonol-4-reductase